MERTYSLNPTLSNESIDLYDSTDQTNSSNKTKLLNSEDKTKLKTNCCVYLCELLAGLLCCYK